MSFRHADAPALDPKAGIVVASLLVVVGSVPGVAGSASSAAVCR